MNAPLPPLPADEGGLRAPPGLGPWGRLWWWLKFWLYAKTARLRFIAVLVAVGGVIAYWDTLNAYYEKWTRPASAHAEAAPDLEFWCPMHPTVIRDHPDKCPICAMPLSKRKKGDKSEEEPLPPGVISRVQLSPYRIALAGIETAEVQYRPLMKEIRTIGFVEFDERRLTRITARVTGKSRIDKLYVNVTGQIVHKGDPVAELYSPDLVVTLQNLIDARRSGNQAMERGARERLQLWGVESDQIAEILIRDRPVTHLTIRSPISGHIIKKYQVEGEYVEEGARLFDVVSLTTVWIEGQVYEDELAFIKEGLEINATTKAFPTRVFHGKVAFIHPHLDTVTRTLRVRFDVQNDDHELRPGMYATIKLEVPAVKLKLFTDALAADWRDRLIAASVGQALLGPGAGVGLEALLHAALDQALADQDLVLAVPETAVIDTGSRKIVYRLGEPGVYEGVAVDLGPRSGGFYPVVRGLEPGERVATAGSFLIDAETRLTGGVGSTYFGASGGPGDKKSSSNVRPSMGEDEDGKIKAILAKLSPEDQKLVEVQKYCPVLKNNRLGSMGRPMKIEINGQPVFLCCKGCEKEAREHGAETLKTIAQRRAGTPVVAAAADSKETAIQAALSKLSLEDRRLAEAQKYCPIRPKVRLGSMDAPHKTLVRGQPVFLCCDACEDRAQATPDVTLKAVEKLRSK